VNGTGNRRMDMLHNMDFLRSLPSLTVLFLKDCFEFHVQV